MFVTYPADLYDFHVVSQKSDGPLLPPNSESGWSLISTNAAEDQLEGVAILLATWAREKTPAEKSVPVP